MADDRRIRPDDRRDVYRAKTPPRGTDTFGEDEPTGVGTDPQVFRAVKALHGEIRKVESQASASHSEIKHRVDRIDEKLDGVAESNAMVVGKIEILTTTLTRPRTVSTDLHLMRQVSTSALAEKVLDENRDRQQFSRKLILQIASGVFSAGVLGAVVALLVQHCKG